MMELIAIEKTDEKAIYEIIGPNDPIDLFGFKDPMVYRTSTANAWMTALGLLGLTKT